MSAAADPTGGYSREGETEAERLDRNFNELLQELRVAETGVQILFAFLLSIAFQQRFDTLEAYQRAVYVITLLSAAVAAVLFIAPVAAHRILFRRRVKDELVGWTSQLAATGLVFLIVAVLGAVLFVIAVVVNLATSVIATGALAVLVVFVWYVLPLRLRRHPPQSDRPR